jgi:hypothetical protein
MYGFQIVNLRIFWVESALDLLPGRALAGETIQILRKIGRLR